MEGLAELLSDMGLSGAHIGIEMDYLPAGDFACVEEADAFREMERRRGEAGAIAADQDAGRDRTAAPLVDDRRQGDHDRVRIALLRARRNWTLPALLTGTLYAEGARVLQVADHRDR